MALKLSTTSAKGLKLKVRKFWGIIPTFVEVTAKNLVERGGGGGGGFFASLILNKVNARHFAYIVNNYL